MDWLLVIFERPSKDQPMNERKAFTNLLWNTVSVVMLMVVPLLLWLPLVLFRLRLGHLLGGADRALLHAPGIWFVLVSLIVCPLAAILMGSRMIRQRRASRLGQVAVAGGGIMLAAFVLTIGIPMAMKGAQSKIPKNPGTPRPIEPEVGLPVFPGAEGFGTRTPAGRGGTVVEVTTLADDGPGSLRAALDQHSPRTVVFRISGTIELQRPLFIAQPFVSVAGQTAPGDGICLKNCGLVIVTHDVLVQHLRIRPGNEGRLEPDDNDAVSILGRHGAVDGAHHVVLDHVSASWSEDECVSTWFGAHDVTISRCIISEALNRSRHRKRTHSAGLLVGGGSDHVSVHHCLMAHNSFRNPLVSKGGTHDFVNNVMYDWMALPGEIVDDDSNAFLNFVGNTYRAGPSSDQAPFNLVINSNGTPRLFVEGNIGMRRPTSEVDEWSIVSLGFSNQPAPRKYQATERFPTPAVKTWSAAESFENVLMGAGAICPRRDAADQRIVDDVRNSSGKVIDSPGDVGGFPNLQSVPPPADFDHDGIPDDWERDRGLNPRDLADGNADRDGHGYTNLEEYLHSLLKQF